MLDEHPGLQLVTHDDRRRQRHAFALTREQAQHRHIVDFGQDDGPDARQIEQTVEAGPDFTIETRQQDRLVRRSSGKPNGGLSGPGPANQADGLLVEEMISKGARASR